MMGFAVSGAGSWSPEGGSAGAPSFGADPASLHTGSEGPVEGSHDYWLGGG